MMKKRIQKSDMSGLLALLLFAVFAVCILSVLLTGAQAYKRLTARDETAYEQRTAAQYLATRVRQGDVAGGVKVGTFDQAQTGATAQGDTLFLEEDYGDIVYATRVYCYNGYLRELFSSMDVEFSPQDGDPVLEAQDVQFALDQNGLLTAEVTETDGTVVRIVLSLRSTQEVEP